MSLEVTTGGEGADDDRSDGDNGSSPGERLAACEEWSSCSGRPAVVPISSCGVDCSADPAGIESAICKPGMETASMTRLLSHVSTPQGRCTEGPKPGNGGVPHPSPSLSVSKSKERSCVSPGQGGATPSPSGGRQASSD